ncbi:MAG: BON domain-containing protein [Pseudomonadota bacterium]
MIRAIVAGVLCAALLAGCASAVSSGYGQGGRSSDGRSYQEAHRDNRISAAVNRLLVGDRQVSAMDIDVATRDGVVTLVGTVADTTVARRAERLATSVEGVVQVINRLRVAR